MIRRAVLLLLLLLASGMTRAWAHQSSDSYLGIDATAGATLEVHWEIALRDLDFALGLDRRHDGRITWRDVRERLDDIDAYTSGHLALSTASGTCKLSPWQHGIQVHGDGSYLVTDFHTRCPRQDSPLTLQYRLFQELDPSHRGLLNLHSATGTTTTVLVPGGERRSFALRASSVVSALHDYLLQGVHHIWSGIDHLLFLVALLLPCVVVRQDGEWQGRPRLAATLMDVARVVTAFTLAHSLTLAAATLGLVNLPARLVESVIAASVVLAALNNLWPRVRDGRWRVAFLFGLVHGFGFASVLTDLALPRETLAVALVGFNLGVELGQLALVLLFVPFAWPLRHTRFYRTGVFAGGSALVAALAAVWLVERAFAVRILPFAV